MSRIGQRKSELLVGALIALGALASVLFLAGFSVDDAWIPVRYARHVFAGEGYRFNVGGPSTDGVTPLPYAWLLVPLAGGTPEGVLLRARVLGGLAWIVAAFFLGRRIAAASARIADKVVVGLVVVLAVPTAAHASSGLETGIATALATLAACMLHTRWTAILAGLAASLRPELLPWAVTTAFGAEVLRAREGGKVIAAAVPDALGGAALACIPFVAVAVVRVALFGRAAPLSLTAKPSDLGHGLLYSIGALATLTPILAFAPVALARAGGRGAVLALAALAHLGAVIVAGGDWMPYARLFVPIAPSLALVALDAAPFSAPIARAARAVCAVGYGVFLLVVAAPDGRRVGADRRALAEAVRPWLAQAHVVAALDIGWPSSVFDGEIIDLAGLTDPAVAQLPGGHTSKRIDPAFLIDRKPDLLLFYARAAPSGSLEDATFPRVVEARLARDEIFRAHFRPRAYVPLGKTGAGYVLFEPWRAD
jgi:hypothetical protein